MLRCSVAICTYNGARFLRDQLASVLAQTLLPAEIVLIDDASSDESLDIARSMQPQAAALGVSFIIRQNPANVGFIRNFENVASACQGDIIFLCDQDDLWSPDKIATLLPLFAADEKLLLVYSDARLVDADGRSIDCSQSEALGVSRAERQLVEQGRGFDALLVRNLVTGATAAFRRQLLDVAKPFPDLWIHDEWLAVMAAAAGSIAFCPRQLIDYRQHDANQIGLQRRSWSDKFTSMLCTRGDFYRLQVQRTEVLRQRIESLGSLVDEQKKSRLKDRLAHISHRANLPASRLARLAPTLKELRSGRYHRYSNGVRAILRDLLETA